METGEKIIALTPPGQNRFPVDALRRPIHDLRISVMDRCNFRCPYCMPRDTFHEAYRFLKTNERLYFDESLRLARVFARVGVKKLRITGGEPLLRPNLADLIGDLTPLPGIEDIALTTNGMLLAKHATELKAAGLTRVTVSLDTLDPAVFCAMNGGRGTACRVLEGIRKAISAGLAPFKMNTVVKRGVNDHTLLDLFDHFRGTGVVVRFIEYMDVGTLNHWQPAGWVRSRELAAPSPSAGRCGPWTAITAVKSPTATRSKTGRAKWVSSRRSRSRSAAPARGRASRPTGRSTPVCSHRAAWTCAGPYGPAPRTTRFANSSAASGAAAARTATASCAPPCATPRIMPTHPDILGFSNPWYEEAISSAVTVTLESGAEIRAAAPAALVATKLCAWKGRGGGDLLRSLDIHDVLTLIDGRPELIEEVATASPDLRTYIRDELSELRTEDYFDYAVESATASYGPVGVERARLVHARLDELLR